ncbi:MAG: S24 family peptidase [Pseudomonadota bacterium]
MDRVELVGIIDKRLAELRLSAAEASRRAVGNQYLVRNIKERGTVPTIDAATALLDALGYDLVPVERGTGPVQVERLAYGFTSRRVPLRGLGHCGLHGWGRPEEEEEPVPISAIVDDPDAFYVKAVGTSMVPEGIEPNDTVLVSPNHHPVAGDRVYVEDRQKRGSLKRLTAINHDSIELRGWTKDGRSFKPFAEKRKLSYITVFAKVMAVYEKRPVTGEAEAVRPDPTNADQRTSGIPLLGYASAGEDIVFDATLDNGERVAGPPYVGFGLGAIAVRGNSMAPVARDGGTILIDISRPFLPGDCIGELVIARDREGGAYLKTLRRGDDGKRWNLESADHRFETKVNVDIEQVFPVRWIGH